jgi:hypothetical protein
MQGPSSNDLAISTLADCGGDSTPGMRQDSSGVLSSDRADNVFSDLSAEESACYDTIKGTNMIPPLSTPDFAEFVRSAGGSFAEQHF